MKKLFFLTLCLINFSVFARFGGDDYSGGGGGAGRMIHNLDSYNFNGFSPSTFSDVEMPNVSNLRDLLNADLKPVSLFSPSSIETRDSFNLEFEELMRLHEAEHANTALNNREDGVRININNYRDYLNSNL